MFYMKSLTLFGLKKKKKQQYSDSMSKVFIILGESFLSGKDAH